MEADPRRLRASRLVVMTTPTARTSGAVSSPTESGTQGVLIFGSQPCGGEVLIAGVEVAHGEPHKRLVLVRRQLVDDVGVAVARDEAVDQDAVPVVDSAQGNRRERRFHDRVRVAPEEVIPGGRGGA